MSANKNCCPECFGDRGLREDIIPALSPNPVVGKCDFCKTENISLVAPKDLMIYFELLVDAYEKVPEESANSITFLESLKKDWNLFKKIEGDDLIRELLNEILDDFSLPNCLVKAKNKFKIYENDPQFYWEKFKEEIMHNNRWFLRETVEEGLKQHISLLVTSTKDYSDKWFRARIATEKRLYNEQEMGAPPKDSVRSGRANPAGIPYLYLASESETAIAEVRPHIGELVCVAEFQIKEMKVIDLRDLHERVSPFILESSEEIAQLLADLPLLKKLGEELARPVLPRDADIDYIPSQYLCELIKKSGFDGVVYRSSAKDDGFNLALFDPKTAKANIPILHSLYKVTRLMMDYEQIM